MKIALKDIVNNVDNLKALLDLKLPVKISYRIKRLVDKINPILETYNQKRNDLIMELGEKQEDGSTKVVDPDKVKEFSEKLMELLTVEEEIDYTKIKVDELGDVKIEPAKLVDFVFEE